MKPLKTLLVERQRDVALEQIFLDRTKEDNEVIKATVALLNEMFFVHALFAEGGNNHGQQFPEHINEDYATRIGILLGLDYKKMRDEGSL